MARIQKVATKAVRQAKGTVRQLRTLAADMANGRERTLTVDGNAYDWIGVRWRRRHWPRRSRARTRTPNTAEAWAWSA
ncbi:hypothetical protein [Streptomyces sp. NPDC005303]|uniref:hypothetical protein n=1 Tax=Streptomyces sp. NPDC005303 TaxID=3155713 RepID=UPI0033A5720E